MLSPSSVEKVSKVAKYILKQKNKIKFNKNEMKLGGLTGKLSNKFNMD